jgi:hypothetical protein
MINIMSSLIDRKLYENCSRCGEFIYFDLDGKIPQFFNVRDNRMHIHDEYKSHTSELAKNWQDKVIT